LHWTEEENKREQGGEEPETTKPETARTTMLSWVDGGRG